MMINNTIALFGEAERGEYRKPYFFDNIPSLAENLGNPPPESKGLHFAVQALLYKQKLLFFRVQEEGFSLEDYYSGLNLLRTIDIDLSIRAIYLPGVGNGEIINEVIPFCNKKNSILIMTERDFYDFVTHGG